MGYKLPLLLLAIFWKIYCANGAKPEKYCSPNQRGAQFCTMQYEPVCAYHHSCYHPPCLTTRGNPCMACSDPDVEFYTLGSCGASNLSKRFLDQSAHCAEGERNAQLCNEIFLPVCGLFYPETKCEEAGCKITFSNRCEACKNPNVERIIQGACNES
jgi:hypothetical protein